MGHRTITSRMCRAASRLERTVNRALDDAKLTPVGYRLMAHLDTGGRAATALAEKLSVSRPTVTVTTDRLESQGLVSRTPDTDDRRRVTIEMTAEGIQALREADESMAARLQDVLEPLSDEDTDTVLRALELLHDALDEHRLREHARTLAALGE